MRHVFAVWKNKTKTYERYPNGPYLRSMVLDSVFEEWFAAQMYVDSQTDVWGKPQTWTDILEGAGKKIPGKGELICGSTDGWQIWKMPLYEDPEEKHEEIRERKRKKALEKLTDEEVQLLGVGRG